MKMTIKEAILKTLDENKKLMTHIEVRKYIQENNYYMFSGKTPDATISALLGDFIRNGDNRVKRIKTEQANYLYYFSKFENELNIENEIHPISISSKTVKKQDTFHERDLHKLFATYLHSQDILSKTILHEESKNSKDDNQKWLHPDIIGISFLEFKSKTSENFLKTLNKKDLITLTSYELKKEIKTDSELKKYFFQAVSNSSWANKGYLVAFDISDNLKSEIARLSQSFGIGVIQLKSNPFESEILFESKFKNLDFTTIDKLCNVNSKFDEFILLVEKYLTADEKYMNGTLKEFDDFCDKFFTNDNDSEILEYCKKRNIPVEEEIES